MIIKFIKHVRGEVIKQAVNKSALLQEAITKVLFGVFFRKFNFK